MGGDEEAWIALGRTAQIMDNLIAQGKAKPMIVVMTNGNADQEAAPGESSLGLVKPNMQLPKTMEVAWKAASRMSLSLSRAITVWKKEIQPCDSRTFHGRFPFFAYI